MNYFDRKCSNSEFIHNLTSDVRENLRPINRSGGESNSHWVYSQ